MLDFPLENMHILILPFLLLFFSLQQMTFSLALNVPPRHSSGTKEEWTEGRQRKQEATTSLAVNDDIFMTHKALKSLPSWSSCLQRCYGNESI